MSIIPAPEPGKVAELEISFTARGREWAIMAWSYNDGSPPFLSVTSIEEGGEWEGDDANADPDARVTEFEIRILADDGMHQLEATAVHPDIPLPLDL